MDKFGGIDLHSNNSVEVISDEADRVVYKRRLLNDVIQIRADLGPYREELVGVVIEATFNWYWYWLVDDLIKDGYQVHLANLAAIRQYEGLKYSRDFMDAAHLAQLLRLGLLPEGHIYPPEQRPVRDLSRGYDNPMGYWTWRLRNNWRQTGALNSPEKVSEAMNLGLFIATQSK
jgi:transposase